MTSINNDKQIEKTILGHFVVSKQGRDCDRAYIVVSVIDDNFVFVADGKIRKLDNPKKKRKKHLHIGPKVDSIFQKLSGKKKIFDSELFSAINSTMLTLDLDLKII